MIDTKEVRRRIEAIVGPAMDGEPADPEADVGSRRWWRSRRNAVRTRVEDQLRNLGNAIAEGGTATMQQHEAAHRVIENLKDDLRLGRAAYARVQMGRMPKLLAYIESINDQIDIWNDVTQLSPKELLDVKGKLQTELDHIMRVADMVLDAPTPLAGRVAKPVIDESSREEKARRQVLQGFLLEINQILRRKAIEQGLLEAPGTPAVVEVVDGGRTDPAGTSSNPS